MFTVMHNFLPISFTLNTMFENGKKKLSSWNRKLMQLQSSEFWRKNSKLNWELRYFVLRRLGHNLTSCLVLLQKFYIFSVVQKRLFLLILKAIFSSSSSTLYTFLSKSAIEKMEETMIKCCI